MGQGEQGTQEALRPSSGLFSAARCGSKHGFSVPRVAAVIRAFLNRALRPFSRLFSAACCECLRACGSPVVLIRVCGCSSAWSRARKKRCGRYRGFSLPRVAAVIGAFLFINFIVYCYYPVDKAG